MRCYFAYGSNMSQHQMAKRCPGARYVRKACVEGYRFRITCRGVATIVPESGARVYGVLWKITAHDEHRLDKYEGVRACLYDKRSILVQTAERATCQALVYTARGTSIGSPRPNYLEGIIEAATGAGLPHSYLEELRTWLPIEG